MSAGQGAVVEHGRDQALVLDDEDLGAVADRHARPTPGRGAGGRRGRGRSGGRRAGPGRRRRRRRTPPWGCRRRTRSSSSSAAGTRSSVPGGWPSSATSSWAAASAAAPAPSAAGRRPRQRVGGPASDTSSRPRHDEAVAARLAEPRSPARPPTAAARTTASAWSAGTQATTRLGDSANSHAVVGAGARRRRSPCRSRTAISASATPEAVGGVVDAGERAVGRPASRTSVGQPRRARRGRGRAPDRRSRPAPTPSETRRATGRPARARGGCRRRRAARPGGAPVEPVDHAEQADDRRRVDVAPAALVVEAHVAADDGDAEGPAGLAPCRRSPPTAATSPRGARGCRS